MRAATLAAAALAVLAAACNTPTPGPQPVPEPPTAGEPQPSTDPESAPEAAAPPGREATLPEPEGWQPWTEEILALWGDRIHTGLKALTLGERIGVFEHAIGEGGPGKLIIDYLAGWHQGDMDPDYFALRIVPSNMKLLVEALEEFEGRSAEQRKLAARWRYGCQLARTAVSENTRVLREPENGGTGGRFTPDLGLIHQVASNSRPTDNAKAGSPLPGLAAHAGHVNLLKLPKPGNRRQPWTRALPCEGDAMPDRWVDVSHVEDPRSDDNPKGGRFDGDWRTHGPHWVRFRDRIIKLALKGRLPRPCPCRVQRWGSWEDVCADRNLEGWCICDCGDGAANYALARVGQGCELTLKSNPAALCVEERRRRGRPIGATLSAKEAAGW